jgi:hypoxanthine phosphoribosyltransferase
MKCHNCGSDVVYTIARDLVCDNCEIVYEKNLKLIIDKEDIKKAIKELKLQNGKRTKMSTQIQPVNCTKIRICCECKKEIENAVCNSFITHINEDKNTFTCFQCWNSYYKEKFNEELHTRQCLERILKEMRR